MRQSNFFTREGPTNHAVGERTISSWKTEQTKVNDRNFIKVTEGSDGNEQFLGQTFEVIAYHFNGQKILFNGNLPVSLPSQNESHSNTNTNTMS